MSELKRKLLNLLCDIPFVDEFNKRKVLITLTDLDDLAKNLKLEGSTIEFCNNLLELLIAQGKKYLLEYIPKLCELDFIGIEKTEEWQTLAREISNLDLNQWNKEFIGKINTERNHSQRANNQPKKIIENYLNYITQEIEDKYKYDQAIKKNYIYLSGIQTQAYEESFPKSTKFIPNLDKRLISNKKSPPIIVYGSPGSGKSTTLYNAFKEYKSKFISNKKCMYIPIFIHANEIANILDKLQGEQKGNITSFLSVLYKNSKVQCKKDFIDLLWNTTSWNTTRYKLVVIVDALDEFVDKTNRAKLFDFLSTILEKTYPKGTKWILSCREKEYRGFAGKLKVTNIRIKSLSPIQFEKLLAKELRNQEFQPKERRNIRRVLNKLREANKRDEIYLTNPYYLSLWVYLVAEGLHSEDDYVPSINELHESELRREFIKSMEIDQVEFRDKHPNLVPHTIKILSVLSYYVLEQSLKKNIHEGIAITDYQLLQRWSQPIKDIIEEDAYDKLTRQRVNKAIDNHNFNNFIDSSEELNFNIILNSFKKVILNKDNNSSLSMEDSKFIIVLASIIEQSFSNNLIKFKDNNIEKGLFDRFSNQRVGDYLAGCYLNEGQDNRLSKILKKKNPNFWLSRAIAIAIASAEEPKIILDPLEIPEDYVFESAIVDGLILMQSEQKKSLSIPSGKDMKPFLDRFIEHLLKEERLNPNNEYDDICAPLRLLVEVRRLLINGYSNQIEFPVDFFKKLISIFLNKPMPNIPVCRELYLTWFAYACNVNLTFNNWLFILLSFFKLVKHFEFNKIYNNLNFIIEE